MTKIPYDITYYVRRQLIKKIVWVAVLTAALAVFFAFFGAAIFGERCPLWLVAIFSALIALLPFLLSGLPRRLLDSSFEGVIKKIEVKQVSRNSHRGGVRVGTAVRHSLHNPGRSATVIELHHRYTLLIACEDGKERRVTLGTSFSGGNIIASLYHVGDTVGHVAGTQGVYYIKQQNIHTRLCIICGSHGSSEDTSCHYCGMPYVLPEE